MRKRKIFLEFNMNLNASHAPLCHPVSVKTKLRLSYGPHYGLSVKCLVHKASEPNEIPRSPRGVNLWYIFYARDHFESEAQCPPGSTAKPLYMSTS